MTKYLSLNIIFAMLVINISIARGQTFDPDEISSMAWSPSQTLLAVGRINGNIEVINVDTSEIVESWSTNEWAISDIDWNPDTNLIATGNGDGYVHVWQIGNDQPLQTFLHNGGVVDVEWIPSHNQLMSVANVAETSRNFKVWDTTTWTDITSLDQTSVTYQLEANAEGTRFISPIDRYIVNDRFYPVDTIDFVSPPDPIPTFVSAAWHPTQSHIVGLGTIEGTVYVHNLNTDQTLQVLQANETANTDPYIRSVRDVAFSPSGNLLYAVSTDGTVRTWDTNSWQTIATTMLGIPTFEAQFGDSNGQLAFADGVSVDTFTINQAPTVTIQYGFTFVETLLEGFPNPVIINVSNEFYTDDPDGDALTYEWRITYPSSRAGVIYAGSDASVTLNIGAPHDDYCNPMILSLTATDPYGASASDTTTVSFVPLNTTGQCVPEF